MLKLLIATTFALSLGTIGNAYGVEPTFTITDAAVTDTQTVETAEVCSAVILPKLMATSTVPKADKAAVETVMSCAQH